MRGGVLRLCVMLGLATGAPGMASEGATIDCPLRDSPYSIDSPLIDVLLKPEAKAALVQGMPGFPVSLASTTPPTFSAIVTPRVLAEFTKTPVESLVGLNDSLAKLPVTDADKQLRCARYDVTRPDLKIPSGHPRILLFEKITGFKDGPSVEAAHARLVEIAGHNRWSIVATDKGGAFTPSTLRKFDVVVWNNVSGDVLTVAQREAFKRYIERGGGFVGLHGSGGDPVSFWDWYVDALVGARFAGHPMNPQFQQARVRLTVGANGIGSGLPTDWQMKDEWYSFKRSARDNGATVIAVLDETSYSPRDMTGKDLRMGDHPIVWTRCLENGRAFYSAIGHLPESYSEPNHQTLLEQAILWAAGKGSTECRNGHEVAR